MQNAAVREHDQALRPPAHLDRAHPLCPLVHRLDDLASELVGRHGVDQGLGVRPGKDDATLGPNGVAARTEGSIGAMNGAYERGLVFDGKSEIPYIDWRNYLDESLNMHNARQSFAARLRMREHDGDSSNQAIWFTDGRPAALFDQTPMALGVMDQWLANIRAHPELGVAGNKPADAVDSCFATNGSLIYRGADAWNGIIDSASPGPCTQA